MKNDAPNSNPPAAQTALRAPGAGRDAEAPARPAAADLAADLPSFTGLFGPIDRAEGLEARSVLSPAAYLVDLLQLKDSIAADAGGYHARRPDVGQVPLDDKNTFGEVPHLEIANGIMRALAERDGAGAVGPKLAGRLFPPPLPFDAEHERLKLSLARLETDLSELRRRYQPDAGGAELARLRLGLSEAEYGLFITQRDAGAGLDELWGVRDEAERAALLGGDLDLIKQRLGLSLKELKTLLAQDLDDAEIAQGAAATFFINHASGHPGAYLTIVEEGGEGRLRLSSGGAPSGAHLDRLMRFVRAAKRLSLAFADLDWVLQTACANELDADAVRAIAVALDLRAKYDLTLDRVCCFWAIPKKHGRGDGPEPRDLFDRVFNEGYALSIEALAAQGFSEALASRLVASLRVSRADYEFLTAALAARGVPAAPELAYFALLFRLTTLARALGLSVRELVTFVDTLDAQWATASHDELALPVPPPGDDGAGALARPVFQALAAPADPPRATLTVVQKLARVKAWLDERQLSARQLAYLCLERFDDGAPVDGVSPDGSIELALDELHQAVLGLLLQPGDLQTGSLSARGARIVFDALVEARALAIVSPAGEATPPKAIARLQPTAAELAAALRRGFVERLEVYAGDLGAAGVPAPEVPALFELLVERGYLEPVAGGHRVAASARGFFLDRANLPHFFLPEFEERREAVFDAIADKALAFARAEANVDAEALEAGGRLLSLFEPQARALQRVFGAQLGLADELFELLFSFVFGTPGESPTQTFAGLALPLFAAKARPDGGPVLADAYLASRFRRLQQFALIARKAGLTADEARAYLQNQRVHQGLPEALKLPEGFFGPAPRVDALTTLPGGEIALVSGAKYAAFSPVDYRPLGVGALAQLPGVPLPPSFQGGIDAAFRDADGALHVAAGEQYVTVPGAGEPRRIADAWGKVRNHIQQQQRVDAAFQDEGGRVFLFRGDQYVRYSDPQQVVAGGAFVDEGYPKSIGLGFEHENVTLLPSLMNDRVDAAFRDADGSYYFFSGDKFTHSTRPYELRTIRADWGVVQNHLFDDDRVDAAFVWGEHTYLLRRDQLVRYEGGAYGFVDEGYPVSFANLAEAGGPLRVLKRFAAGVEATLAGADGNLYAFEGGLYASSADPDIKRPIVERWGRVRNHFVDSGRVDASLYHGGAVYLFSGDQYVRYSGPNYQYVDEGYPKRIRPNWNSLETAGTLPDALPEPIAAALVGDAGEVFFFGGNQYAGPGGLAEVKGRWARVRNNVEQTGRVDAALVDGAGRLYLFSGDQFYRYTSPDQDYADEGYPKRLAGNWALEGPGWALPEAFTGGISAALRAPDGKAFFFRGDQYARVDAAAPARAVEQDWGVVRNTIAANGRVDAAFCSPQGVTYLFGGDQFVRYAGPQYDYVDEGFPQAIGTKWGNLPANFRAGIDAALAFTVQGVQRLYLFKGREFVRYSGGNYAQIDPGYPKRVKDGDQSEGQWFHGFAVHDPDDDDDDDDDLVDIEAIYVDTYQSKPRICLFYRHNDGRQWRREYRVGSNNQHHWTNPQRVDSLSEYAPFTRIDASFVAADGRLHLFSGDRYASRPPQGGPLLPPVPARDVWARVFNQITQLRRVDATLSAAGGRTYLFCAQQFTRYSGPLRPGEADFYADEGYPKKIATGWAAEGVPVTPPPEFQPEGVALVRDAGGQIHLFDGAQYTPPAGPPLPVATRWGRVENRFEQLNRVDATYRAENGKVYLFCDDQFTRYSAPLRPGEADFYADEGYPKRIEGRWPLEALPAAMPPKFSALGHAVLRDAQQTYVFAGTSFTSPEAPAPQPVVEHWAKVRNQLQAQNRVDAGFVLGQGAGAVTLLFCDDQYVRYSGGYDGFVDEGYPKRIARLAEVEGTFAPPEPFLGGVRAFFAGRDGNLHAFTRPTEPGQAQAYVCSADPTAALAPRARWGIVDNELFDQSFVNAALLAPDGKIYLFSGDQYVKYSGADRTFVDEGYPKRVVPNWADEIHASGLPAVMAGGVDAALVIGGVTFYFAEDQYVVSDAPEIARPLVERWGLVDNRLQQTSRLDAAFVAPDGRLYLFSGDQYATYSGPGREYVDEGYPKRIDRNVGQQWPAAFQRDLDSACAFEGRSYLFKGDAHVRIADPRLRAIDPDYPRPLVDKFIDRRDFELTSLPDYWGFKELADTYSSPPLTFLQYLEGPETKERLSLVTKWSEVEIERLLAEVPLPGEGLADSRTLVGLARHFDYAERLGATPSNLKAQIWARAFGPAHDAATLDEAAELAYGLVKAKASTREWPAIAKALRDPLNAARRDALVAFLVHERGLQDGDDLYEYLLHDVNMGPEATNSRVAEAIASAQLYYHRALMNLEEVPAGLHPLLKEWWPWMKNYRIWEANRKVFLYPENYLRPELRTVKSPAFAELEQALLQDDVNAEAVHGAYTTYLEKFAEISRLRIAGGYTYRDEQGDNYVLMFGFARTEPLTYYHRFGKLPEDPGAPIAWNPWEKLDIAINAEQVRPVYAFNKIFLFWQEREPVNETVFADDSNTTYGPDAVKDFKPVIKYSFYNFNKKWINPQTLRADLVRKPNGKTLRSWPIEDFKDARLYVTNPSHKSDYDPQAYVYILFAIRGIESPFVGRLSAALDFEPGAPLTDAVAFESIDLAPKFPERLAIEPDAFSRWGSYFQGITTAPWFSFDASGGSFLCRPDEPPAISIDDRLAPTIELKGRTFAKVDAAFSTPEGDLFVFATEGNRLGYHHYGAHDGAGAPSSWQGPIYTDTTLPGGEPAWPWGRLRGVFEQNPGRRVQNVVVAGGKTYVMLGSEYFTYASTDYRVIDQRLPSDLPHGRPDLSTLTDGVVPTFEWQLAFDGSRELVRAFKYEGNLVLVTRGPFGVLEYASISFGALREYVSLLAGVPADLFDGWDHIDTVFLDAPAAGPQLTLSCGTRLAKLSWQTQTWATGTLSADYRVSEPSLSAAFVGAGGKLYFFSDSRYAENTPGVDAVFRPVAERWGHFPSLFAGTVSSVDAALLGPDKKLYLFCGPYCLRFSGFQASSLSTLVADDDTPPLANTIWRGAPDRVTAALRDDKRVFLFSTKTPQKEAYYARYSSASNGGPYDADPDSLKPLRGGWGNLPTSFNTGFDAALELLDENGDPEKICLLRGAEMIVYDQPVGKSLYEIETVKYSIVRLTSNTAERFSQTLLGRGVEGLLSLATQRTPELPVFVVAPGQNSSQDRVVCENDAYLSDYPGKPDGTPRPPALDFESANGFYYWEIFFHIPFLIAQTLNQAQRFEEAKGWYEYVFDPTEGPGLEGRAFWKFLPFHEGSDAVDWSFLEDADQLRKYRDDPFDPHGLAQLRPVAYRKAFVMSYIDNLLDWGDLLFQQYTRESVGEATMLYVLAADLLGKRPEETGKRRLELATMTYDELRAGNIFELAEEHLLELENATPLAPAGAATLTEGTPNDTILNEYFFIPENVQFIDYWGRVGDRLFKIRHGLNIEGVRQSLALFEPPVDVLALVKAFAAGGNAASALSDYGVLVPHYRFTHMLAKARDLVGRLTQLGGALLSALEKQDAEELNLLRNTQERTILEMTSRIKQHQLENARQSLLGLRAGQRGAQTRQTHYQQLLAEGLSSYEKLQLASMAESQGLANTSSVLSNAAAVANLIAQFGSPFAITFGGQQIGPSLAAVAQIYRTKADKASFASSLASTLGGWDRRRQDWQLQRTLATHDIEQLGRQIAAAEVQVEVAQQDIQVHRRQIQHNLSIDTFMKSKFSNRELYRWTAGKLSALYFQTYQMALDYAKAAQRAMQFELGFAESDVQYVGSYYWDSLKKGLLSGEQLQLDLDRLDKAYCEKNRRRFEITKTVSLLAADPLAFLRLKQKGACEFELTEALFDADFPGHYCRQIKAVSVSFPAVLGPYDNLNATLTQVSHRTVLRPEIGAVRYLLTAEGDPPAAVRADWRPNQQVALSRGVNDNGLFQLNFQDERYLPFEGTGAVSRWRLEINGADGALHRETLTDVVITVQYSALPGGDDFAEKVKGELPATERARMLNLAYDFPQAWQAFLLDPARKLNITLEKKHLPGASQANVSGLYLQYDLTESGAGAIGRQAMRLNAELELPPGSPRDNLAVPLGNWQLVPTGRLNQFTAENIRNISLVVLYQSKPAF